MKSSLDAPERLFVTLDRSHFRVYRERTDPAKPDGGLEVLDAVDFPRGKERYTDQDSDQAGRFPTSKGRPGGMSIDERLPLERERDRRLTETIAERLEAVIRARPTAVWFCAAGPDLHKRVLERLTPDVRQRLQQSVTKDLSNAHPNDIRRYFDGLRKM